jgi:glutathione S-transferase
MTAPPLILHHHDPSPFAEKIRVAFGIKHLAWRSVLIPMIMPKPDLTALTGGYRGTPVLQIGADIYCDSRLIMEVIDELFPSPPLLKSGPLPNFGLQHWSDETLFPPGAALAMHENRAQLPVALIADREAYFTDLEFGSFARDARHFHAQFSAHAALIDRQLGDGRAFLLGNAPEWADINAYFPIWMANGHFPSSRRYLDTLTRLTAWQERMAAFGHGVRSEIDGAQAIELARRSGPLAVAPSAASDESCLAGGGDVTVWPVAHPDTAVDGRVVAISAERITIAREDPRAGALHVHFPRIGYRAERRGGA